ncbi:polysaccharide biosynthesis/export family protein [Zunongwangia sp.]|uniref:polysaccharide biosynthesis/export family protein n=1 Tax=Zunongwangia sp. TaxID=1965325 RepID=UPI003AA7CC3F
MENLQMQTDTKKSFNNLQIKPNDRLAITVSAEEVEAAMPFNLPFVGSNMSSQEGPIRINGTPSLQTYLVNSDGEIQFPVLGSLKVAGLDRKEVSRKLKNKISEYVQNPIVNVQITNFQISVLGEVNRPGTFIITDEYVSLPKALGLAGDMSIYGKRKNVLVVREKEDGNKTHAYLDLTDANVINSPYYYLQQNDVVYIEPNGPQRQSANYNRNASVYISIASVLVSLAVLITR